MKSEETASPEGIKTCRSSSSTIPMPLTHIRRTDSEEQLRDEMVAAEVRDQCMFHRISNAQNRCFLANMMTRECALRRDNKSEKPQETMEDSFLVRSTLYHLSLGNFSGAQNNQEILERSQETEDFSFGIDKQHNWSINGYSNHGDTNRARNGHCKKNNEIDDDCVFNMEI